MSQSSDHPAITFIGAGNMASSIIGGLLDMGQPADRIRASDPFEESLQRLSAIAPVATSTDNTVAIEGADVVVLAVKPQVMADVADGIRDAVAASGALVISIAAGITIQSLQARLGDQAAIIRCMPNTPALLQKGATALYANSKCDETHRARAEAILRAVGSVYWVGEEALLDAVTALSGSGPAYFFLMMEAMADAGEKMGLDADTSRALAIETGLGAALMAAQGDVDLLELRGRVTSPGGTTQAAIESFEQAGFRQLVESAMDAAKRRAEEMAREMG